MRAPSTVKLVDGLHPETPIPKLVRRAGWSQRVAIVLDSYVPGVAEMYFDSELFLAFLQLIDESIGATTRRITMSEVSNQSQPPLGLVSELRANYQDRAEEDRELPEEIIWYDGDRMIGAGFAENWYAIGGPAPYHDSFTLSVFTDNVIFPAIVAAAPEICARSNAQLTGVSHGANSGERAGNSPKPS